MVVSGKGTELSQKGSVLQIKQDDKFFCRLLSKETSMSHPSFRVAAVAVPFVWESQPGTPKYTLFSEDTLPPLTPPPSYYTSKSNQNKPRNKKFGSRSNNNSLLFTLLLKLRLKKSNSVLSGHNTNTSSASSPEPSSFSSTCSPSWVSLDSSSKVVVPPIGKVGRRRFLSIGSSFDFWGGPDDEEEEEGVTSSPTSTLCFGIHRSASSKGNNGGSWRR